MRNQLSFVQGAAYAGALLRGFAEFVMLQRWRLRGWLLQRPRT
jgi:hypothetical protein